MSEAARMRELSNEELKEIFLDSLVDKLKKGAKDLGLRVQESNILRVRELGTIEFDLFINDIESQGFERGFQYAKENPSD